MNSKKQPPWDKPGRRILILPIEWLNSSQLLLSCSILMDSLQFVTLFLPLHWQEKTNKQTKKHKESQNETRHRHFRKSDMVRRREFSGTVVSPRASPIVGQNGATTIGWWCWGGVLPSFHGPWPLFRHLLLSVEVFTSLTLNSLKEYTVSKLATILADGEWFSSFVGGIPMVLMDAFLPLQITGMGQRETHQFLSGPQQKQITKALSC